MKNLCFQRRADYRMEQIALRELKKADPALVCGEPHAVPIEDIIEKDYGISIEYHYLRKNLTTLGQMVFDGGHVPIYDMEKQKYTLIDVPPKSMLIDIRLLQDRKYENRLRFSYAHELAHYIYHKEYFSNSQQSPALIKGDENVLNDDIEREANMLCSYLLVPTGQMKRAYYRFIASGKQAIFKKGLFNTMKIDNRTRVDRKTFEEWFSNQTKYPLKKSNDKNNEQGE